MYNHGIAAVALRGKHNDVVGVFKLVERVVFVHFDKRHSGFPVGPSGYEAQAVTGLGHALPALLKLGVELADAIHEVGGSAFEVFLWNEGLDVHIEPFIPQEYFEGTTADFMDSVSQLDAQFEQRRQSVAQARHRLRFVARWANGEATVSLVEVDENHPFYKLEDSNNVVVLTTERYRRYPMIIQGYGAGAEVTAAGVFADIMRVANI